MLESEYKIKTKKRIPDSDRWKNVIRLSKNVFQVNSQRSELIFHYVKREMAVNADGTPVFYFECSDCPGFTYYGHCWHVTESEKVFNKDPDFKHEVKDPV